MDYSTSINDADNPAGASPWGSSPTASPQHPRPSTFPNRDIVSPTPYNPNQPGSAGYSQEDIMGSGNLNRPDSSAGASGSDVESRRPDTAESTQSNAEAQPGFEQQYHQQTAPQQQYSAGQPRPEPQRYHHSSARQGHHPPAPHYKLQAKITGLERTGRKDPILRFDVHVSHRSGNMYIWHWLTKLPRPIFQNLEQPSFAMCDELIPNSSSWQII